jgi:hypothetical protein
MVRHRLGLVAILVGSLAMGACREHTVDLGFRPDQGEAYTYRYEIEAVVTRSLEGEEPEVTELDTVLLVDQEVLDTSADGARVEVEIRRDGGPPRNAVVVLDRAGSLQGIEAIEGLAPEALVASSSLLGPTPGLPDRHFAPGATWSVEEEGRRGTGRVERLGVIDDAKVAEVRTTTNDEVREQVDSGGSTATLQGDVSSRSTTSYDLDDGAIRRSTTASVGELAVQIAPPAGIDAAPVDGTISYDVRVRVTRLR